MTDHNHTLHDDIAFLRSMAEEGRQTPVLGGSVLLAAGLIFGLANGAGAWIQATHAAVPQETNALLPLGAFALFFVVLAILKRRVASRAGTMSPANRATAAVWRAVGWSIMLMVAALVIAASRLSDWRLMAALPIVIFALYGAGWQVAATVTRIGWMRGVAVGSYVAAGLIAWFIGDQAISGVVTTVGLLAVMAAPGFVLMRRASSLKV
jgi:hypothetical protein